MHDSADLSDFTPFKVFASECEERGIHSRGQLNWLIRFREHNGLLESGAIVELCAPGSKRPRLFVNRKRWPEWLARATQYTRPERDNKPREWRPPERLGGGWYR
jgi:hypothetical protein